VVSLGFSHSFIRLRDVLFQGNERRRVVSISPFRSRFSFLTAFQGVSLRGGECLVLPPWHSYASVFA